MAGVMVMAATMVGVAITVVGAVTTAAGVDSVGVAGADTATTRTTVGVGDWVGSDLAWDGASASDCGDTPVATLISPCTATSRMGMDTGTVVVVVLRITDMEDTAVTGTVDMARTPVCHQA